MQAHTFQVDPAHQFHRRPAIWARYGVSNSTLYRWMSIGIFPAPVKLGPNLVAWREADLREFDADPETWAARHRGAA